MKAGCASDGEGSDASVTATRALKNLSDEIMTQPLLPETNCRVRTQGAISRENCLKSSPKRASEHYTPHRPLGVDERLPSFPEQSERETQLAQQLGRGAATIVVERSGSNRARVGRD